MRIKTGTHYGMIVMKLSKKYQDYLKKQKIKDKRLYTTYGITLKEWQDIKDNQKGVCWICKGLPKSGILCVDHLHIKGYKKMIPEEKRKYVRGLICFTCNTAFGRIERRKNPRQLLERIVEYFKIFPIKGDIIK